VSRLFPARPRVPSPTVLHFAGALLSKLVPPGVQLALLLVVARLGTLEDVGRLALASAAAFTCGGLAELGFGTSLSVPRPYFGTELPPVRGTRPHRLAAALAGSAVYLALWAFGLGGREAAFLVLAPLPALLALGFGYAGVMNAHARLDREGRIAVAEALLTLALAGLALLVAGPLVAALLGLLLGRALGTLLRARVVRGLPQDAGALGVGLLRAQGWFVAAGAVVVIGGQIDVLAAGFVSAFATLGVFSPLMRTAYGLALIAEALSWSLYGRAGSDAAPASRLARFVQNWSVSAPIIGAGCAVLFVAVAPWFVPLVVDADVGPILGPVLLFAGAIVARFVTFSFSLELIRAGRQRARLPGLVAATVVLACSGIAGALAASLTILAAGRLIAEVVVAVAYGVAARRGPAARGAVVA
jgi:O-antigen/teichoic acid export membrane protein